MKNILKIAILSMVLINCSNNDNNVPNNYNDPTTFEPQNIDIEIIGKGGIMDYESIMIDKVELFYVIRNESQIDNMPDIFIYPDFSYFYVKDYLKNKILQSFDFNEYQALVVFNEFSMGSASSIDIISVTEYEENIVVVLDNINGKKMQVTDVWFPYEIVKMPKIDKPVEFDTSLLWKIEDWYTTP